MKQYISAPKMFPNDSVTRPSRENRPIRYKIPSHDSFA
jgi:hypothetical protein